MTTSSTATPLSFVCDLVAQQGDIARYETPFGEVHFFNHPDQVRAVLQNPNYERTALMTAILGQGLVASDGAWWRQQRRLMQPHFHDRCLPAFAPIIVECAVETLKQWKPSIESGAPLDLCAEMQRMTLEVIVRLLFSQSMGNDAGKICGSVSSLLTDLSGVAGVAFNFPNTFSPARNAQFAEAQQTLNTFMRGLIAARREMSEWPRDLLTVLLKAQDQKGEALSDQAICDEIISVLIAGHETTGITMTWLFYRLAEHPEIEQRLLAELDENLEGRLPTLDDLPKLPNLRMIMDELIRIYPPTWFMMRRAVADGEVGGSRIPAGANVLISAYTTHRHKDFWPDPERFDPERFRAEEIERRHRYAYFPFSAGRHNCLGEGLALIELPLLIATLVSRVRVTPCEPGLPNLVAGVTLRVEAPTQVTMKMRG